MTPPVRPEREETPFEKLLRLQNIGGRDSSRMPAPDTTPAPEPAPVLSPEAQRLLDRQLGRSPSATGGTAKPVEEYSPLEQVGGTIRQAANTAAFGLGPKLSGLTRAAVGRLTGDERSFGEAFREETGEARERLRDFSAAHPNLSKAGTVAGVGTSLLAAVPAGMASAGIAGATKVGAMYGGMGGALSGLADSEGSLGEQAGQVAGQGILGTILGGVTGQAAGRASRYLADRTTPHARGVRTLSENIDAQRPELTRAIGQREAVAQVAPRVADRTPAVTHAPSNTQAQVQRAIREDPGTARLAARSLNNLRRETRRIGQEIEEVTIQRANPTDVGTSPRVHDSLKTVLQGEADHVPVMQEVYQEVVDRLASRGRPAGWQKPAPFNGTWNDAIVQGAADEKAIIRHMFPNDPKLGTMLLQNPQSRMAVLSTPVPKGVKLAQDLPLTLEFLDELQRAGKAVVDRGLQRGGKDQGSAKEIANALSRIRQQIAAGPDEDAQKLMDLKGQYKHALDALDDTQAAVRGVKKVKGRNKGEFEVASGAPPQQSLKTVEGRAIAEASLAPATGGITPQGIRSAVIGPLQKVFSARQRKKDREVAKALLQTGERGTDILSEVQLRARHARRKVKVPVKGKRIAGVASGQVVGTYDPDR